MSEYQITRCDCCDGSDVFTCEMCGNGLASEPIYFCDSASEDPNTEHAIWVCPDCKERNNKEN